MVDRDFAVVIASYNHPSWQTVEIPSFERLFKSREVKAYAEERLRRTGGMPQ